MLYEIRNYHYDPSKYKAYLQWGREEAAPFLKANLDVIGIWMVNGEPPEIWGSDIEPRKHGPANVTWIIRWDSMEHRNLGHKALAEDKEWQEIWSRHPDPDGYLHCEVTFAEEV